MEKKKKLNLTSEFNLDKLSNSKYSILLISFFHLAALFTLFCILSFFDFINFSPNHISLMQWDAGWYADIVVNGYSHLNGQHSNTNFFPLFPLIWEAFQLSPVFISIFNLFMMLWGMIILKNTFHFNNKEFLIFLSIPSLFFCYVPYSEAIFFLSGSILLYGIKKNFKIALLGALLIGLSRSVSVILIPIILFSFLFNLQKENSKRNKEHITKSLLLIAILLVSLLLAQFIQSLESGKFFTLFETQKAWERELDYPEFFFTTWGGLRLLWLDGLAYFVGLSAIIICAAQSVRKIRGIIHSINPAILISTSFLALTTLYVIFYAPKDANGGTTLASLNRYIFASPFFMVFLHMIFKTWKLNALMVFKFLGLSMIVWFSLGGHQYYFELDEFSLPIMKSKLYFLIVIAYSFAFFINSRSVLQKTLWAGLYIFNMIVQAFLFDQYLSGQWIG